MVAPVTAAAEHIDWYLLYLVTPTFATLRRDGRSRRFDSIFTIENGSPRLRGLPRHPRLLDASQTPPSCLMNAVWNLALGHSPEVSALFRS